MKIVKVTPTAYKLFIRPGIIDPWYHIAKERCATRAQFEKWIDHLENKNWFTAEHVTQFEAVWKEGIIK